MKRAVILCLIVLFAVSCEKKEQEYPLSNLRWTPCLQSNSLLKSSSLSDKVEVEFTDKGVQITYSNFEVTCDFTTVDVTHTFVKGVLRITQQSSPKQANCICYTDVSYTIEGFSQDEVNVIFINEVQVYCHNSQSNCDPNVIISAEEYENTPNLQGVISNVRIEGNYLKFRVHGSGCDGSNWVVKLIDQGGIAKSNPPQRALRVYVEYNEDCLAVVSREFSFNIECLQVPNTNKVWLNILENGVLYEY